MLSLTLILAFLLPVRAENVPEKEYRDADFSLRLEYPASLFVDDSLTSPEGFKLFQSTAKGVPELSLTIEPTTFDEGVHWEGDNCSNLLESEVQITYQKSSGNKWCVYSYSRQTKSGTEIRFVKTIHSPGKIATLSITYPEKSKSKYEKVVSKLADSFSFYNEEVHKELTQDESEQLIRSLPEVKAIAGELNKAGIPMVVTRDGVGETVAGSFRFTVAEDHEDHLLLRYRFEVFVWKREVWVEEPKCGKSYPLAMWRLMHKQLAGLPEKDKLDSETCEALTLPKSERAAAAHQARKTSQ
jgi:hypothetical protein